MSDPTVFCLRCAADVSALPPAARYCRRCGVLLPYRPPAASAPSRPPPLPVLPYRQTQILVAYGRALFNLGWRYEHAPAWRRNPDEATRCYGKAARLGDAAAAERLAMSAEQMPPLAEVYHPPLG